MGDLIKEDGIVMKLKKNLSQSGYLEDGWCLHLSVTVSKMDRAQLNGGQTNKLSSDSVLEIPSYPLLINTVSLCGNNSHWGKTLQAIKLAPTKARSPNPAVKCIEWINDSQLDTPLHSDLVAGPRCTLNGVEQNFCSACQLGLR